MKSIRRWIQALNRTIIASDTIPRTERFQLQPAITSRPRFVAVGEKKKSSSQTFLLVHRLVPSRYCHLSLESNPMLESVDSQGRPAAPILSHSTLSLSKQANESLDLTVHHRCAAWSLLSRKTDGEHQDQDWCQQCNNHQNNSLLVNSTLKVIQPIFI